MCVCHQFFSEWSTYDVMYFLQAKSLGHGISGTLYLVNPVSLFKYDAVSRIDRKGECAAWMPMGYSGWVNVVIIPVYTRPLIRIRY